MAMADAPGGHRELAPLPESRSLTAMPVPVAPVPSTSSRRAGSHNGFHKELALAMMGVLAFATVWLIVAPAEREESQARKSSSGTLAQQQADLERELRQSPPAAGPPSETITPAAPSAPSAERLAGHAAATVAAGGLMAVAPEASKANSPAPAAREVAPKSGAATTHLSACTQALLEESLGAAPRRKGSDCR